MKYVPSLEPSYIPMITKVQEFKEKGIPIVGAVGGFFDGVYMRNITKYAELKYRRRFYTDKKNGVK